MKVLSALLPGETLYSWCAFQHLSSASKSSAMSALDLLGKCHATRQLDLPPSLICFPFLREGGRARIEYALRQHTVAGYYWPFLGEIGKNEILEEIVSNRDSHWRHRLCAQSRSRPFSHPLKWCKACLEDDQSKHGRSYWHVQHQLPLSYSCIEHHCQLQIARPQPKVWLAVRNATSDCSRTVHANAYIDTLAARLGQTICSLDSIEIANLRYSILLRLREMGVIISIRSAQHKRITNWFKECAVARWCAHESGDLAALASGNWIAGLLWRRRVSHPILWTVLWMALDHGRSDDAIAGFLNTVEGVFHGQLHQLSLFPEVIPPRRAPQHVRAALMESKTYAEAMKKLSATRGDIVRWLEDDYDLRMDWREYLRRGHQAKCETTLREAIGHFPDLGWQYLEKNHGAEIRWLREHAPMKVHMMLRSLPKRGAGQRTIFDDQD